MATADATSLTPIRRQYLELKARHPGAILLFRLGDFYETFDEDAELVARELDIALTSRPMGKGERVPLAGVPYHAVDGYLAKLIGRGYRVAICEQLADPKDVKGIVPRGVVRVVSPGTVMEPELLEGTRNNYLAAYLPPDPQARAPAPHAGIAYVDITTSEFAVCELAEERALAELERLGVSEVLVGHAGGGGEAPALRGLGAVVTEVDEGAFDSERGRRALLEHFRVASLEAYGCERMPQAMGAAGAILEYLKENQPAALPQVTRLRTYSPDGWMQLDRQTRRNLELFSRAREGTEQGSLFSVLNLTRSPMGARLVRRWVEQPLIEVGPLSERLDAVEWLVERGAARAGVLAVMGKMPDLERLLNRVRGNRAGPRDLLGLLRGLRLLPDLGALVEGRALGGGQTPALRELGALIEVAIDEEASAALDEGNVIKAGFSPELDRLRERVKEGQEAVLGLEWRERERTGIKSLKVGYNRVFGYYIEVSNAHRRLVPEDYMRKQTLVGAERFFTAELKSQETGVLASQERIAEVEAEAFRRVCGQVGSYGEAVLEAASAVAYLDVVAALAEVAARYGYVRPRLDCDGALEVVEGRHPVVERQLADGFVPNDVFLASAHSEVDESRRSAQKTSKHAQPSEPPFPQIAIITGPNMSGKSTYLRQVALIVLMAQIGSFVPARSARIGIVDRIFSRIGAQDDLATGQSTFMVEMAETAQILHHATAKSLVILDELGRGTSTYDGISIAQAVVEYLHQDPEVGPKTLFATHYHELTRLAGYLPRVKNFTFAVTEGPSRPSTGSGNVPAELVFLRRLVPGSADQSYGVQVARLAGLPASVTRRAEELLEGMQRKTKGITAPRQARAPAPHAMQMPLWNGHGEVMEALQGLDLNGMTPIEALTALYELQERLRR